MSRKNPQIRIRTNKKPLKSEEQPAKSKKKKKKKKRAEKTHYKNHHREKRGEIGVKVKMRGWPKKIENFEERVWGERKCMIKK